MRTIGLRESKKEATRLALAQAVLTRAQEQGIEHVTIEAVAADAGVSVRTFHNYFSGKEDAVIHFATALAERVMTDVRARPRSESLWRSLRFTMIKAIVDADGFDPATLVALLRLFDSEPSLVAHGKRADLERTFNNLITDISQTRGFSDGDFYPYLAFHQAFSTARAALEYWVAQRDTAKTSAEDILNAAFDQAEYGMTQPLPTTKEF